MTTETRFTIIDDGRPAEVPACVRGDQVRLSPQALEQALGWTLKPEGLCRANVCVPLRARDSVETAEGVDLDGVASALGRPLAVDGEARAAYLGVSAHERGQRLSSLDAPDFTLPDLEGRPHSLSEQRGKKVLLVAWASW
jgi:hypothetical protein